MYRKNLTVNFLGQSRGRAIALFLIFPLDTETGRLYPLVFEYWCHDEESGLSFTVVGFLLA